MGQPGGQREAAVAKRHLKRLWALPGTQLGVVAWPAARRDRSFGTWHYWWQAHLLDCLVDAQVRDPQPERRTRIDRQIRGASAAQQRLAGSTDYYDDMAWLALALERAGRLAGVERPRALQKLADQFVNAWVPEDGGGIPWRKQDQFFNAPANGPAGIFLARYEDRLRRAQQMADWIDETLIDPETHLVFDGIKAGSLVRAQYTYCQGVVLGLETELAARTDADAEPRHGAGAPAGRRGRRAHGARRACSRVRAAATAACSTASWRATWRWSPPRCRGDAAEDAAARDTARTLVLSSARVGVGLPADRRRAAAVRRVLGPRRRAADGGQAGGAVRRGCGQRLRDPGARPVGAAVGLDADGGRL